MYKNKRRNSSTRGETSKKSIKTKKNPKEVNSKFDSRKRNIGNNKDKSTSQRVTVPLDFFSQGVKSKTVRRDARDCTFREQSCHFLKEDLHALLQTVSETEAEVTQNQPCTSSKCYESVTDYYVKLESEKRQQQTANDNCSIFREVNCRFQESGDKPAISNNLTENLATLPLIEKVNQSCFCRNLMEQLHLVTLSSRTVRYMKKITAMITEINTVLEGQETIFPRKEVVKSTTTTKTEANTPNSFLQLIPKSSWLYRTPSNQKLRRPQVSTCTTELKPCCLIQAGFKSKTVFELDTSPTKRDVSNVSYDTFGTPLCDIGNNSVLWNFRENFKIPIQNTDTGRNMTSVFNNNTVPVFESVKQPFQGGFTHDRNLLVPHRPRKATTNVIRDKFDAPRCLFRQKTTLDSLKEHEKITPQAFAQCSNALHFNRSEVPATVSSQMFLQLDGNNKENYTPQDLSNHPKPTPFSVNESFVIDDDFLFPPVSDPPPISFYPRKVFGSE